VLGLVFIVATAAGIVMALPYSMMMTMMPQSEHGVAAGVYELSRGVGVLLGPLIAGSAIELLGALFPITKGYAAIFLVTGAAVLASLPFIWRLPPEATDPEKR
jgi:MFS family permease